MAVTVIHEAKDAAVLIVAFLSMLLAAQEAAPSAYPVAEVLSAARQSCARDFLPSANVTGTQWQPFRPEPGSWPARLLSEYDRAGGMNVTGRAYRATVAGRELVAVVREIGFTFAPDAPPIFNCEVFDRSAEGIDQAAVRRWARARARRWLKLPGGGFVGQWEPGLSRGAEETTVRLDLPSADAGEDNLRSGLSFTANGALRRRRRH